MQNRVRLSGEGNENGEKTTIGLISKSNFSRAAHFLCTFLCPCFARLQRETSRSFLVTRFMEEMYLFLFTFFHISHYLTAATKFHVFPPTKNVPLGFFYLALALFSR